MDAALRHIDGMRRRPQHLRPGQQITGVLSPFLAEGLRESTESWADLLRDCRRGGTCDPEPVVGDGAMGFWKALAK